MLDFLDGIKNVLPIIKNFALAIGVVLALFAAAAGIYILRTVLGPFIRVIQWLIAYTPRKEPNDIVKGLIYGLRMLVWGCIVAGVVWFTFHEKSEAWIMDMETHVAHQEQPGGKMFGAAVITTFLFGLALAAGAVYYFRTKEPPVEIVESAPRIVEKIVEKFVQAKQTLPSLLRWLKKRLRRWKSNPPCARRQLWSIGRCLCWWRCLWIAGFSRCRCYHRRVRWFDQSFRHSFRACRRHRQWAVEERMERVGVVEQNPSRKDKTMLMAWLLGFLMALGLVGLVAWIATRRVVENMKQNPEAARHFAETVIIPALGKKKPKEPEEGGADATGH